MLGIKTRSVLIKVWTLILITFLPVAAHAVTIDEFINREFAPVAKALASVVFFSIPVAGAQLPLIVLWLVVAAVFFTVYFNFLNIRGFLHAVKIMRGDFDDPKHPGEVSHFQALCTAVSGTVGIGNIGGVAVAISLGGPGATFWMVLAGLLGMSTKFIECTLGIYFRRHNPDGSVSGGPMYFLDKGLAGLGLPKLGKSLGMFYASGIVIACLGIGNMFQSNQAYQQVVNVTGGASSWFADRGWVFGALLAVVVALVILGGIKSIARVTSKVVPFMAFLYCFSAIVIVTMNYEAIPFAIDAIITGAFSPDSVAGGMFGVMIIGFQRAVFSNEAGIGSAAIAHAAVQTDNAITEGYVSLLEPFIDTIVICSLTALVIITTLYYEPALYEGLGGIEMTSAAFERNVSWSPYLIAIAGLLFAFSTMIAWAYYGLKGWTYLVGESRLADISFKFVFCMFVVIGCSVELSSVLDFSDAMVFLICVPNLIGLYIFAPLIKRELKSYQVSKNIKSHV
jgi:AGCS family alanine or glycine:cation symporter